MDLNRVPFSFETVNALAFLIDWTEELQFDLDKQGIRLTKDIRA